jgi:ABC-2 type transport system ATP-binding protein
VREHGGPSRLVRWRRVVAAHRRTVAVLVTAALVLAIAGLALAARGGDAVRTETLRVAGTPEPGRGAITLDATLYLPRVGGRVPAVLIAHGFGGSKSDVAADARWLATRGYAALAYTARGFGRSGGLIHLDSPDYEVKDAQRMLDVVAARREVRLDAVGDPRVGVVGGSYGGALALLLAGTDHRVDAIVPSITWNDLRQSLLPQFAVAPGTQRTPAQVIPVGGPGVFKRMWAADLLGGLVFGGTGAPGAAGTPGGSEGAASAVAAGACGRVALDICLDYARTATAGVPTEHALQMLAASSPARVLDRITAPTLLVQGETDSLFPLSEADANAAGIAANGTTVKLAWMSGGHDVGLNVDRLRDLTIGWLDRYLRGSGPRTDVRFEAAIQGAGVSSADSEPVPELRAASGYPGLPGRAGSPGLRE